MNFQREEFYLKNRVNECLNNIRFRRVLCKMTYQLAFLWIRKSEWNCIRLKIAGFDPNSCFQFTTTKGRSIGQNFNLNCSLCRQIAIATQTTTVKTILVRKIGLQTVSIRALATMPPWNRQRQGKLLSRCLDSQNILHCLASPNMNSW